MKVNDIFGSVFIEKMMFFHEKTHVNVCNFG